MKLIKNWLTKETSGGAGSPLYIQEPAFSIVRLPRKDNDAYSAKGRVLRKTLTPAKNKLDGAKAARVEF